MEREEIVSRIVQQIRDGDCSKELCIERHAKWGEGISCEECDANVIFELFIKTVEEVAPKKG